jgi:hypothetical protein
MTQTLNKKWNYSDFVVGAMWESDRSVESFVWVIVSHTDLQFNGFEEFSLLSFSEDVVNGFLQEVGIDLAHL